VQAAVPGSSEPSGQSQYSSLIWEGEREISGFEIHVNVSADL
jgi:hypothetical protein